MEFKITNHVIVTRNIKFQNDNSLVVLMNRGVNTDELEERAELILGLYVPKVGARLTQAV